MHEKHVEIPDFGIGFGDSAAGDSATEVGGVGEAGGGDAEDG